MLLALICQNGLSLQSYSIKSSGNTKYETSTHHYKILSVCEMHTYVVTEALSFLDYLSSSLCRNRGSELGREGNESAGLGL